MSAENHRKQHHKKKSTSAKKSTAQSAQPARPGISSWRRTLNCVLLIVLCVMFVASASYSFFAAGSRSVRVYAPMLLLEICLFKYVYDTGKTAEGSDLLQRVALLICGAAIVLAAGLTVLSLLHL